MIGKNLLNYEIKSELGRGGMAIVYLAEHNLTGEKVAVKVLNADLVKNENIRKRFVSEARNLAEMSHRNIVKVCGLFEDVDTVAFVMDCIQGQTLKKLLKSTGKMSDDQIKNVFLQMLDALTYVHQYGLVHRDVKPSNFMLDHQNNLFLMDFGIAKIMDASAAEYTGTERSTQLGTPAYMSPEQTKSAKDVDQRSDIYSLGVVLYEMVTGYYPFGDLKTLSIQEIQACILRDSLPWTDTIWNKHIAKSTNKNELERYQTFTEWSLVLKQGVALKMEDSEKTIAETVFSDKILFEAPKVIGPKKPIISKKAWLLALSFFIICCIASLSYYNFIKHNGKEVSIGAQTKGEEVSIGSQIWMAENLNVDKFRNGDLIPESKTDAEWKRAGENKQPVWCYYENDSQNGEKYGKLYNWFAVSDPRSLAPEGWHIPTDAEWITLSTFLGGGEIAGKKMKSTSGWSENGDGDNSSGFSSLPGGSRDSSGYFDNIVGYGYYWTASEFSKNKAYSRLIDHNYDFLLSYDGSKEEGMSVRCLRD